MPVRSSSEVEELLSLFQNGPHLLRRPMLAIVGADASGQTRRSGRVGVDAVARACRTRDARYVLECASAFHILIRTACGHACAYNANQALLCSAFYFLCFYPLPSPPLKIFKAPNGVGALLPFFTIDECPAGCPAGVLQSPAVSCSHFLQ